MNNGQEKFLNFILQRVTIENQDQAKELLSESFTKQEQGSFNEEYMMNFIPRMLQLIKPECRDEVQNIMRNHKA
ncbi:MAG: hypothetical protein ACRCTE_06100 [Cellulosilyticaceae bacterium]